MATTHAPLSSAARRLPMLALALAIFLAVSSTAQLLPDPTTAGDHLMNAEQQRGLLAADDVTIVPRKNVTKAELIKLLDQGVAPAAIPADATKAPAVTAGGRKLSQRAGYCRNSYYTCGVGCYLRCSGSRGFCFKNLWRCAGTINTWYCSCGFALQCFYTRSGVYATCVRR